MLQILSFLENIVTYTTLLRPTNLDIFPSYMGFSPTSMRKVLPTCPYVLLISEKKLPPTRLNGSTRLIGRLKFIFSKKATKIEKIFTVFLTLCSKCQIDGEDFVNFCDLLRKHEL